MTDHKMGRAQTPESIISLEDRSTDNLDSGLIIIIEFGTRPISSKNGLDCSQQIAFSC